MPLPAGEPGTPEEVRAWIDDHIRARDRFSHVKEASYAHQQEHDCDTFPMSDAPKLGFLAAAIGAGRILEVGCGLGYGALWLALGSSPDGRVETIEKEPVHAALAARNFEDAGYAGRIVIVEGRDDEVLAGLAGPYDFLVYDAAIPGPDHLEQFSRLVRPGGLLVTSNLFLGQYAPDAPGLEKGAEYRRLILEDEGWFSTFWAETAVSVRAPGR